MISESIERPPHKWVAEKIGFSVAGVSLLRGGLRQPSMTTMEEIERCFGWSIGEQVEARHAYAPALEKVLETKYAEHLAAPATGETVPNEPVIEVPTSVEVVE